jgi:hypothetical protein
MQSSNNKQFIEDKKKLENELKKYLDKKEKFTPLYENMEKLNDFLKQRASS